MRETGSPDPYSYLPSTELEINKSQAVLVELPWYPAYLGLHCQTNWKKKSKTIQWIKSRNCDGIGQEVDKEALF